MEETLKITNVFSDPTRFNIYQYLLKHKNKPMTVLKVAKAFDIHPNVARLHLSKLEEIGAVVTDYERTGMGGRPSKLYQISQKVIELNFPYRDYKMLASIALETLQSFGIEGERALYKTGELYGKQIIKRFIGNNNISELTVKEKMAILEEASSMLGLYPQFDYNEKNQTIIFDINNCPFKEVTKNHQTTVCHMHHSFLKGMLRVLFNDIQLTEINNMFEGCMHCQYKAKLSVV